MNIRATIALASLLFPAVSSAQAEGGARWPMFRGPSAQGIDDSKEAPLHWNLATGENVLWKTAIPGLGLSSPVIWEDQLFLTTALAIDGDAELKVGLYGDVRPSEDAGPQEWRVLCLNRNTGDVVWNVKLCEGVPKIKRHPKASHANSTAAVDGKHVVAFFGSEGLYCLDREGQLKWKKSFGVLDSGFFRMKEAQWGFASSPIIVDGKVIVQCDVQENSFLAAFNVENGEELWRTPREEIPTWSTPNVFERDGKAQVVVNGYRHIGGYDLETGAPVWRLEGGGDIPVPTPIIEGNVIIITNAHGRQAPMYAIRTNASGTITVEGNQSDAVIWWEERRGNYMQTPIVVNDRVYGCTDSGILSCFELATGKRHFMERLRDGKSSFGFTASPVSDGRNLYFPTEDGKVIVVKVAPTFERLAENEVGEACMATPALVDGVLYVRGRNHLFAFGN